jgi:hypothetical protein
MGGDARWTAAAIRMDGGSKIKINGGSGNGNGGPMGGRMAKLMRWAKWRQWEAMQDGWQR